MNPMPINTEPNVSYNAVFRRKQNGEFIRIATSLPPNTPYIDYMPASDVIYEYYVRALGANDTFSESGTYEAEIKLNNAFIQRTVSPSNPLMVNALEREETYNLGGKMMVFANRKKPVFEHGIHEMKQIPITFFVDSDVELRNTISFIKRRETFLYRDSTGRKIFCVLTEPSVKDKIVNGFEISLTLSEVDFEEVVQGG